MVAPRGEKKRRPPADGIPAGFIETVTDRLRENLRVRRTVPEGGRLHIDRQLPFLLIYRRPSRREDSGTDRLVVGEASYLIAPGGKRYRETVSSLVRAVARTQAEAFGAFLVLEVWSVPMRHPSEAKNQDLPVQTFRLVAPKAKGILTTLETLEGGLRKVKVEGYRFKTEIVRVKNPSPAGMEPLLTEEDVRGADVYRVGIGVPRIYRNDETGEIYPIVLRRLHRKLSRILRMGVFQFTRSLTVHTPPNFQALGPRAMVKAVWEADRQLAEIESSFDFLLLSTASNPQAAWAEFRRNGYDRPPELHYRPVPVEPAGLKRALFRIPLERIEDPTMAFLFREKQGELDRLITMLSDRGTQRFLYGSLQVFGGVGEDLARAALDLLDTIPPRTRDSRSRYSLDAAAFAQLAREEVEHYRVVCPDIMASVEVREDIRGLLVSRNRLLVGKTVRIPAIRVQALLQHEVGTHLLTYMNASLQPLRQLKYGLAGYDDLQEGLAVLAEHFTGGLTRSRLRFLAARVIAISRMVDGATFVDNFRELVGAHGLTRRKAFDILLRTYRGGGLTKDVVYLRGLLRLIKYFEDGGDVDILFTGKFSRQHLPIIRELLSRGVLSAPVLRPRYMDDPRTLDRIDRLRTGVTPLELTTRGTFNQRKAQ